MEQKKIMSAEDVTELYQLLTNNGIKIWLDGGWGVDALLEKQTRPHGDVDIVVQEKDLPKLREILEAKGYKDVERDDARAWNFVLGDESGREVDVHVIVLNDNGNGIYGPVENRDLYPAYALAGKGKINGQEINCLSAKYQVESHTGYKLRDVDFLDVTAMCEKFGIELPEEYKRG